MPRRLLNGAEATNTGPAGAGSLNQARGSSWRLLSEAGWCCITSIYSRVAGFKPVDALEVAQAAL